MTAEQRGAARIVHTQHVDEPIKMNAAMHVRVCVCVKVICMECTARNAKRRRKKKRERRWRRMKRSKKKMKCRKRSKK